MRDSKILGCWCKLLSFEIFGYVEIYINYNIRWKYGYIDRDWEILILCILGLVYLKMGNYFYWKFKFIFILCWDK